MPIPRPKILSVVTIPTGGWVIKCYIDNGGSYNDSLTATLAAGDYFVAFDQQSDDFVEELHSVLYTAFVAKGVAPYNTADGQNKLTFTLNNDGTVTVHVTGAGANVRIAWTENDGVSIGNVLGFDTSANTDVEFTATGTYHHAYGWYATEDGQLSDLLVENSATTLALQSRSVGGTVKTQYINSMYSNELSLNFLTRSQTYSRNVGYTAAAVHPYAKNKPLECWWQEARQGKRFRVYRDGYPSKVASGGGQDVERVEITGTATGATNTTLTDSGRSFTTDPQEHAGKILAVTAVDTENLDFNTFRIASHTATVITVSNALNNDALNTGGTAYRILDQTYDTYVLDLGSMSGFAPRELPNIDRYSINIPLRKYV